MIPVEEKFSIFSFEKRFLRKPEFDSYGEFPSLDVALEVLELSLGITKDDFVIAEDGLSITAEYTLHKGSFRIGKGTFEVISIENLWDRIASL